MYYWNDDYYNDYDYGCRKHYDYDRRRCYDYDDRYDYDKCKRYGRRRYGYDYRKHDYDDYWYGSRY